MMMKSLVYKLNLCEAIVTKCFRSKTFVIPFISRAQYCTVHSEASLDDGKIHSRKKLSVKQANICNQLGPCEISGWVLNSRFQKQLSFIVIGDGLSSDNLQVVVPSDRIQKSRIEYGACIKAIGTLVQSPAKGQVVELQAENLSVTADNCSKLYPFSAKTRSYSPSYLRQHLHIRARQPGFAAMLRLRSACSKVINEFFDSRDFVRIDTPVLTSNNCEGGVAVFHVKSSCLSKDPELNYFGQKLTYLTVSGQLHLEAINSGIAKVYSYGPTFRADNAVDRTHLAEFYMVEGEIAFIENLTELTSIIENMLKCISQQITHSCKNDINILLSHKGANMSQHEKALACLEKPFHSLSYSDAIILLQNSGKEFSSKPVWGNDLHREHEHVILAEHDDVPVFITDWPRQAKPFYALLNDDEETVASVDLIVPGPGELFGGSLREHRFPTLESSLEKYMNTELKWYLDLRRYGSAPHGGFGMGLERFLQFLLGINQIRDAIPFPRYANNCKL